MVETIRDPSAARREVLSIVRVSSLVLLAGAIGQMLVTDTYNPAVSGAGVAAAATFSWSIGWWATRRAYALALLCNVSLLFLYAWSLDEQVRVEIRATPHGYVASVGGNVVTLHRSSRAGNLGFYAGYPSDSLAPVPQAASPSPLWNPLIGLGRLAAGWAPGPAWKDVQLSAGAFGTQKIASPGAGWRRDVRSELAGSSEASMSVASRLPDTYTFSAFLDRGAGMRASSSVWIGPAAGTSSW
jgi:hypothetical protein